MPTVVLVLEVRVAWWLSSWLRGLALFCAVTGIEPDWGVIERVCSRAVTIRTRRRSRWRRLFTAGQA